MSQSVTRHVQISQDTEWRFLAANVDSLDVGLYVEWGESFEQLAESLERGKKLAEGTDGIPWEGRTDCLIRPNGKGRNYRWHLLWPEFHLFVAKNAVSKNNTPNVYASINSHTLWSIGVCEAVAQVRHAVEQMGGKTLLVKPSRCDLAADFHIPSGLSLEFLKAHQVARVTQNSNVLNGDELETFYMGAGPAAVRLRIYHKSKEVQQSGTKLWLHEIWGLDDPENVWRIEFQIRRARLKQVQVEDVADLEKTLGSLWR